MGFEIIKDGHNKYVVDKERKIIMKKKMGSQEYVVFELSVNEEPFEIHVGKKVTPEGTHFDVQRVVLEGASEETDGQRLMPLIKECMEAYKELQYPRTKSTKFISGEVS